MVDRRWCERVRVNDACGRGGAPTTAAPGQQQQQQNEQQPRRLGASSRVPQNDRESDQRSSLRGHSQLLSSLACLMYLFSPLSNRARAEITYIPPTSLRYGCQELVHAALAATATALAGATRRSTQLWWRPHDEGEGPDGCLLQQTTVATRQAR
jgi:hypothetical protein